MSVSIEELKKLREATGVSMMACKSVLEEADGDYDQAFDLLRKKGEAKAADRAGRSTSEGVVAIKKDGEKAAMLTLLCETDFVSKSDGFVSLANSLVEKLFNGELPENLEDVPEVKDAVLKLGENVRIGEAKVFEASNIGDYVHSNAKIGVLVAFEGGSEELAKEVAMHIAATAPQVVSPDEVSDELLASEKVIWAEQLKNEGKPAEIIEKIMLGKEKKFREENALLKQAFVKDPEKTIEQLLEGSQAVVKEFVRFAI
ncbi:translation elongation factor Ts [Patescibacteria group bacterium]|nr:translation elongation factor Ts [Patescibacteria group bacterium]